MKKILTTLGFVALALLVAFGAFFGYAMYAGSKSDVSSKAYVDRVVPEIVGTWSPEKLKQQGSVELTQGISDERIAATFGTFSRLGKLTAYEGSKGESKISISPNRGKIVTAKYQASAKFERGDAVIDVTLVQRAERWQIVGFFVKSDQLAK